MSKRISIIHSPFITEALNRLAPKYDTLTLTTTEMVEQYRVQFPNCRLGDTLSIRRRAVFLPIGDDGKEFDPFPEDSAL